MAKQLGGHSASLPVTVLVHRMQRQCGLRSWVTERRTVRSVSPSPLPLSPPPLPSLLLLTQATCRPGGDESHSHPTRLTRLLGGQLSPGEGPDPQVSLWGAPSTPARRASPAGPAAGSPGDAEGREDGGEPLRLLPVTQRGSQEVAGHPGRAGPSPVTRPLSPRTCRR